MARKQSDQIVETPTEARQAEPGPSVLWLLVISLCLAFLTLAGVWYVFDHRRCVFRKGMPAAARIPLAIGSHPP